MMELTLHRIFLGPNYTIGRLYVDGIYHCDTLEDTYRDLEKENKVKGETCIPFGTYSLTLGIQSPRFKDNKSYAFCDGYLPRLENVPHFDGILIHIGNYPKDTDGCILVGQNKEKGAVLNSTNTFIKLYEVLKNAKGPININII